MTLWRGKDQDVALLALPVVSLALAWLIAPAGVHAQRGRGQAPQATNPRAAAPIDLTGYWASIIVDEWRFRVTPQKGDIAYLPLNPEARKARQRLGSLER